MSDETTGPETAPAPRSHAGRFKPRKPEAEPKAVEEPAPVVAPLPDAQKEHEHPGAVKIASTKLRIPPRPVLTEYHVGTKRSCPHQNVTIGGISFPQFTGGALMGENRTQGARVKLSPEQIDLIKDQLAHKVVRWVVAGDGTRRGQILSTKSPGFTAQHGDQALAEHVYCYPVPQEQKAAEEREPASMLG